MVAIKQLLDSEDRWFTDMGLVFPGDRVVFRGKDLCHDLNDLSWMELLLFGITGRQFTSNQMRLFEKIWTLCTSYPDPRIWNNRIVAYAGTVRSTAALGISAAISISDAEIYGFKPMFQVFDLLLRVHKKLERGISLEKIIEEEKHKYKIIPGYGRPIIDRDERVKPLLNIAKELSYSDGFYLNLALEIGEVLYNSKWHLRINFAALIAALVADQGFNRREYYHYLILCFTAGMFPCFIDSSTQPEGTFLPLRCGRVKYEGKSPRKWK